MISPDPLGMKIFMSRFAPLLIAFLLLPAVAAAAGESVCEACRAEDEHQIGDYVEPALPVPEISRKPDTRGNAYPLPGGAVVLRIKPGNGLWLGSPGENRGDIFANGTQDKASVGWKLGF